jgi:hypothetical protein
MRVMCKPLNVSKPVQTSKEQSFRAAGEGGGGGINLPNTLPHTFYSPTLDIPSEAPSQMSSLH